ncbi:hypothetical protein A7D21_32845 [Pseudomonas sp. AP19]|uniref:hypothetical protein n=1 Tax=Pseudomonas sp. AP19 TaxID=1535623 RepID=UPI00084A9CA9|nr:hypothetical protein [Pseudomonas sp. AP19]OEC65671.1 hypothetical protein A7D21_32845 [Pseudomonas sp. AP19]
MSQHFVKLYHAQSNCLVRVQLGWDRPLQGFYMVVEKDSVEGLDDCDEGIVYSNLDDVGHPSDLAHFKEIASKLSVQIPDVMWRAAYLDSQHNAVNKQVFYSLDGDVVAPF